MVRERENEEEEEEEQGGEISARLKQAFVGRRRRESSDLRRNFVRRASLSIKYDDDAARISKKFVAIEIPSRGQRIVDRIEKNILVSIESLTSYVGMTRTFVPKL